MKNTHTHTYISLLFFVVCGLWVRFYLHLQPPVFFAFAFCVCIFDFRGVFFLSRALFDSSLFSVYSALCSLPTPDSPSPWVPPSPLSASCPFSSPPYPHAKEDRGSRLADSDLFFFSSSRIQNFLFLFQLKPFLFIIFLSNFAHGKKV